MLQQRERERERDRERLKKEKMSQYKGRAMERGTERKEWILRVRKIERYIFSSCLIAYAPKNY